MTSERTRQLYGSIYPAFEWELDGNKKRTGRRRAFQFMRTMRWQAVLPSQRQPMEFYG